MGLRASKHLPDGAAAAATVAAAVACCCVCRVGFRLHQARAHHKVHHSCCAEGLTEASGAGIAWLEPPSPAAWCTALFGSGYRVLRCSGGMWQPCG
jgi:hypothetical protein